jgi:hypothetical protein
MTFNADSFMQDLKTRIPHARVIARHWTPEEREDIRKGLHEKNLLWSHEAALGGGALYNGIVKNEQ